jgi:hypothetical protein
MLAEEPVNVTRVFPPRFLSNLYFENSKVEVQKHFFLYESCARD